jgi:hypothetical protein
MKKIITLFYSLLILLSCNNSVVPKPDKLIDDDQMVDILYDLSILDAVKNQNSLPQITTNSPNEYIYKKYGIDSIQFAQNNKYYASNVAKYKRMYNKVNARLADKDAELTKEIIKNNEKPVAPNANGIPESGQVK